MIEDKRPWSVEQLYALPQESQITRHVCVEGWSMIGKWSGPRLSDFLQRVGADLSAKYVGFQCADGYYGSIDMPTALHPQTIMAFKFADEIAAGQIRLSVQGADPDQARLQESEMGDDDLCHQSHARRVLGGSRLQLVQRIVKRRRRRERARLRRSR